MTLGVAGFLHVVEFFYCPLLEFLGKVSNFRPPQIKREISNERDCI